VKPIGFKMTCLVCLLVLAVIRDIKSCRISNYLIVFGLIVGILFHHFENGWTSISIWGPGILIPVLFLFPLFLLKALGAGDIKLFSVIGCFYGTAFVIKSVGAAFLIAAVMSFIYLIKHRLVFQRLHYLVTYIQTITSNYYNKRLKGKTEETICRFSDLSLQLGVIHFSPAILTAVLLQLIFHIY